MKTKLLLIIPFLFASCAVAPLFTGPAVSYGLKLGIKDAKQRTAVACQIRHWVPVAQAIAAVPTADEFKAMLDQFLPNDENKDLTEGALVPTYAQLYTDYLSKLSQDKALVEFRKYLVGIDAGAAVYCQQ